MFIIFQLLGFESLYPIQKVRTLGYAFHKHSFMVNQRYSKLITAPSLETKTWKDVSRQKIKSVHGRPSHPESQGEVEGFNKTLYDYLSDCDENGKIDGIEPDLRLTVSGLLTFYNKKRKHSTMNKVLAKF